MKYKFRSFLKKKFAGYLNYRKSYGFKADADYSNLAVFDKYLVLRKVKSLSELTEKFYLEMIAYELEVLKPQTVNHRIMTLKNFYKYLERQHRIKHNPVEALPRLKELYYAPHIFSVEEINKILDYLADYTARAQKNFFLVRFSRYSAFALQAACGLRISEVLNLKITDFDPKKMTLFIRKTKFRKDRLIPISSKSTTRLQNYLNTRQSFINDDNPCLFLSYRKEKNNRKPMAHYFLNALRDLGMDKNPEIKGNIIFGAPCPHSLRHSFAVNTVKRWISEGKDIDKVADTLATYMGHSDFSYTQVYLKCLSQRPELLVFKQNIKYDEE